MNKPVVAIYQEWVHVKSDNRVSEQTCASSPLPEMILMHIQAKTSSLKNETWWAAFPKISFMALGQFQSSVNTKFHKGYIWLVYKNCHSAFSFFPTLCGYEDIRKFNFPTWFHECQVKRQKASITETKGWLFKIFFIWLPHSFMISKNKSVVGGRGCFNKLK